MMARERAVIVLAAAVALAMVVAEPRGLAAAQARNDDPAEGPAPWPLWVWVDGRSLGAARDVDAEAKVISQTAAGVLGLFTSVTDAHAAALAAAGEALARGERVALGVRFEERGPVVQVWTGAERPVAPAAAGETERPVISIPAHRTWAVSQSQDAPVLFEVFVDVNALRRAFADSIDDDRLAQMLRAAALANARSIMLHGRLIPPDRVALADPALPLPRSALRVGEYRGPPLLRIDVSWNSRADDLRTVRGANIAAGHWPGPSLRESVQDCTTAAVLRWPWCVRLDQVLEVCAAWRGAQERAAFRDRARTWRVGSRQKLDRLCGSLHGWLIVGLDRGAPGLLRLEARARDDGAAPAAIAADVQYLLAPIAEDVSVSRAVSVLRWPAGRPLADLSWAAAESGHSRGLIGTLRLAGCRVDGAADVRRRAGR